MKSLNLLPPERKMVFAFRANVDRWRAAAAIALVGAVLAGVGVGLIDWRLSKTASASLRSLQTWQTLSAKRESGQVTSLTRQINQTSAGLNSLFGPLSTKRGSVATLLSEIPDDINLSAASFLVDGRFTLTGVAATRASFLALRAALEDSVVVQSFTTDSTASQRENLPFEYTGQLTVTP